MKLWKCNRGKVSVFLSMLISGMVLLSSTSMQVIDLYNAKAKTAMAARGTISSVKAQYNNYIFDNYHILLLDKNCNGKGEAYIEKMVEEQLSDNLGTAFDVKSVCINSGKSIVDNDAEGLRKQVEEYMPYLVVEYSVDKIISSTDGQDGEVPDDILDSLDDNSVSVNQFSCTTTSKKSAKDPMDFLRKITRNGVLTYVKPVNMKLSDKRVKLENVPSKKCKYHFGESENVDLYFSDISMLKTAMTMNSNWMKQLIDTGDGVVYARSVFNCATNQTINPDTVFKCELEYIIAGKKSDYENVEAVANEIILIRLPINFTCLYKNQKKQEEIEVLSQVIAAATGVPPEVTGVLITGAWSVVESMADVKMLLKGKRIAFIKTDDNWITDLNNLSESFNNEGGESINGLCYEDYLMILMALNSTKLYFRMLDVMQLNAQQVNEKLDMKNCLVWVDFDYLVEFMGKEIYIHEEDGY